MASKKRKEVKKAKKRFWTSLGKAIFTFSSIHQAEKRRHCYLLFQNLRMLELLEQAVQASPSSIKHSQDECTFADVLIYLDRLIIGFDLLKILRALTDQFIK